jgi:hypothetical protein
MRRRDTRDGCSCRCSGMGMGYLQEDQKQAQIEQEREKKGSDLYAGYRLVNQEVHGAGEVEK